MDMDSTMLLALLAACVACAGIAVMAYVLATAPEAESALVGPRGLARARALEASLILRAADPVIRKVGSWVSALPISALRTEAARRLELAGLWLGLTADELVASSVLLGLVGVAGGALVATLLHLPLWAVVAAGATLAIHPLAGMREATRIRHLSIERRLPDAVDLVTLCMSAGLDFGAALRRVCEEGLESGTPLHEELGRMLDELSFGKTRANVLTALAERVPIRPILDLVGAAVQAEEKGTPLSDILVIQARMLRMRRSVRAEEAAASAALQLMIPLILMFGAIMLLVLGPVAITVMEGL